MQEQPVPASTMARLTVTLVALALAPITMAIAFPIVDPTNQGTVPGIAPAGTELPAPDTTGLKNPLKLLNSEGGGNPGGWTIVPRITVQEIFTDNAFDATSPRRADGITIVSPGISILADTKRLQLKFDYQPSLSMHAINGPLNVLTQQLNANGIVTVIPDIAYIDVRGLSGVQSRLGALAGAGTIGAGAEALTPASGTLGIGGGLSRQNLVQTSSFGISPYVLGHFGDYGTGKLGVSASASRYSSISGFAASPFPAGGANGQSLLTTEQIAQFTTGEFLGRAKSAFTADVSQSESTVDGASGFPRQKTTSQRQTFLDQVSYAINRVFTILAGIGHEYIQYGRGVAPTINGLIWNVGLTVTPSPESAATVTFGHQNGADSFAANGHLALTSRTLLSFDYSNTIGTQLESLQTQLNNSIVGPNGQVINAQTGGPSFQALNAIGAQSGVFRFNTFNASLMTTWQRDTLQAMLTWSQQTRVTAPFATTAEIIDTTTGLPVFINQPAGTAGQATDVKSAAITWTHDLSPDLTFSSSAAYSLVRRSNGGGTDGALAAAIGLRYAVSPLTTLSARYAFFDRISRIPGYGLYENTVLVGVTRRF